MPSFTDFQAIGPRARLVFGCDNRVEDDYFYFFYHIPKCGGMDVYTTLYSAFAAASKQENRAFLSGRADEYKELESLKPSIASSKVLARQRPLGIFASHLGHDVFEELFSTLRHVRRIGFIREPFSRLVSEYTYLQMRSGMPASKQGFAVFMRQSENINSICHSIIADTEDIESLWSLVNSFYFFTTLDRLDVCLQALLSQHGLANVFRDPINETKGEYRLDELRNDDGLQDEFYSLNRLDTELYQRVLDKPIEPVWVDEKSLSAKTILIEPVQTDEGVNSRSRIFPTEYIYQRLQVIGKTESIHQFLNA